MPYSIVICQKFYRWPCILFNIFIYSLIILNNSSYTYIIYIQVETVAQFGVIFLLFALGLEFSTTKVGIYFSSPPVFFLFTSKFVDWLELSIELLHCTIAASCRSGSCCFRRSAPDFLIYVLVWNHCLGMHCIFMKIFRHMLSNEPCCSSTIWTAFTQFHENFQAHFALWTMLEFNHQNCLHTVSMNLQLHL